MKQRPTGVSVLAILALIGGVLALLAAVSGTLGAWAFGAGLSVALFYAAYSLVLTVFYLVFAFGMWGLKPWAWTVGIICMVLSVFGNLYGLRPEILVPSSRL